MDAPSASCISKTTKDFLRTKPFDIEILSGKHAGFHDSFDARPVGKWLGIPVGAALGAFGFAGLAFRKDDAVAGTLDDDDTSST
jgi:hypothetical protein